MLCAPIASIRLNWLYTFSTEFIARLLKANYIGMLKVAGPEGTAVGRWSKRALKGAREKERKASLEGLPLFS